MADAVTADVIASARAGDGAAFAVIWRELAPAVAGYLTARGVPDPEATTSDVFLAVFRSIRELRGGASGLRTLVFSVAHARVVDETRRRARQPARVEFDAQLHGGVTASAEEEAVARVSTAEVGALLDGLSPEYREVLALRVIADLDLEQTAAVMHRSVGAIKQLQRRALIALRARLGVTPDPADAMTELR